MFVSTRSRLLHCRISAIKHSIQKYSVSAERETSNKELVSYPPIHDLHWKARHKRENEMWYDEIKKIETVEEKLIKLNMPRYYGWKVLLYREDYVPYNSLHQAQHATRTHIEDSGLPSFYDQIVSSDELDSITNAIQKQIEDVIVFESSSRVRRHQLKEDIYESESHMENTLVKAVTTQIHRILSIHLASKLPHLLETHVEYGPRIESCWSMGGVPPAKQLRSLRKWWYQGKYVDDPINIWVQYLGEPMFHLRHKYPLQLILNESDSTDPALDVPKFEYDPRALGYRLARRHITCIPGFWPGDAHEFGLLSYHRAKHFSYLENDPSYPYADTLTTQAVLASFAWLNSQAFNQGFTTFHDVTYPLVSQAIVTNCQLWAFYVYQLNTTLIHSDYVDQNPRRNICWTTKPMMLYEKIENEKLYGFNNDVLKHIIKLYMNAPEKRTNVDMKPYLGNTVKTVADIECEERREWLEQIFKHLVSNRPRHRPLNEMCDWERIFIRDTKKRVIDPKLKPWQKGIRIFRRRLDDHALTYVPRKMRDPSPKFKRIGRFKPTFYP